MEFEARLRRPVVLSPNANATNGLGEDNLVGNVRLDIQNEPAICSTIAQKGYTPQLGARSILNAATEDIYTPLVSEYLDFDEDFDEAQSETVFKVGINADKDIEVWRMPTETGK